MQAKKPSSAVILKRRQAARDYWLQIPPRKVDVSLAHYVTMDSSSVDPMRPLATSPAEQHLSACGLDALQCGTFACVAGWLFTMPEYRDYRAQHMPDKSMQMDIDDNVDCLCEFLGVSRYSNTFTTVNYVEMMKYGSRQRFAGHEWEIGLDRLNKLVEEAST